MDKEFKILLQKYRDGQISLDEEIILAEKLSDHTNNEIEYFLQNDLQEFLNKPVAYEKDLKHSLDKIHHRIRLIQTEKQKRPTDRLYHWSLKVAAMLFLPLLAVSLFLLLNNRNANQHDALVQIIAPKGSRVHFELPDGTTGMLNSESELSYSTLFTGIRRVRLTGEAYFDVAKDIRHSFIVNINNNEVLVTGTRFSLAAWPGELRTELVLEEGSVIFKVHGSKYGIEVDPGQRLVEENGHIVREDIETWKYTAWKDGKLVFRDDPLEEVAGRISRWYNVDVEVSGEGLEEYRFRGVFEDDPLEEVLRLLKITSSIDYKIQDRVLNFDGSFSRKKVILIKE